MTISVLKRSITAPTTVHAVQINGYFGKSNINLRLPVPEHVRNTGKLFLCFTNRCGSNYLAEILASTGKFNLAGEFFNWDVVVGKARTNGFHSLDEYVIDLVSSLAHSSGFISKISCDQLILLNDSGILDSVFPDAKYLVLERGDKLGQAISLQIASQTLQWTSYMESAISPQDIKFDADAIGGIILGIAKQYQQFDLFFAATGKIPALVGYEALVASPETITQLALDMLGFGHQEFALHKVRTMMQRDMSNENFRRQYLHKFNGA